MGPIVVNCTGALAGVVPRKYTCPSPSSVRAMPSTAKKQATLPPAVATVLDGCAIPVITTPVAPAPSVMGAVATVVPVLPLCRTPPGLLQSGAQIAA